MSIISAIIVFSISAQSILSACLSTNTLNSLGFYPNSTAVSGNPNYCKNLHSSGGNCVGQDQLQFFFDNISIVSAAQSATRNIFNNAADSYKKALQNNTVVLARLVANSTNNFSLIGQNLNINTLLSTEAFNQTLNTLFASINNLPNLLNTLVTTFTGTINTLLTTTLGNLFPSLQANTSPNNSSLISNLTNGVQALFDYSVLKFTNIAQNAVFNSSECLKNYYQVTSGLYCYVTSTAVTQNSVTSTIGAQISITVNVQTNTVGPALAACLPLIDQFCILGYGLSLSDAKLNLPPTIQPSSSQISKGTCESLQAIYNCTTSNCLNTLYTILINQVYSAAIIRFLPTNATLIQVQNSISNLTTNLNTLANTLGIKRTLQSSTSATISIQANSTGQNIIADGLVSGYTYKGSMRLTIGLMMMTKFIYFN